MNMARFMLGVLVTPFLPILFSIVYSMANGHFDFEDGAVGLTLEYGLLVMFLFFICGPVLFVLHKLKLSTWWAVLCAGVVTGWITMMCLIGSDSVDGEYFMFFGGFTGAAFLTVWFFSLDDGWARVGVFLKKISGGKTV